MDDILKPCPFCGGAAFLDNLSESRKAARDWYVHCTICNVQQIVENESRDAAVSAWNSRHVTVATWRPIETAPKEYPILVCGPYSEYASIVQWNWPAREWRCQANDCDVIERQDSTGTNFKTFPVPTHWRFLPGPRGEGD